MTSRIIASVPRRPGTGACLLQFDATLALEAVRRYPEAGEESRLYGLCRAGREILAIYTTLPSNEDERCGVLRLDAGLGVVAMHPLSRVRLGHSLIPDGDGVLVVNTKFGEIVRVADDGHGGLTEEPVWRIPDRAKALVPDPYANGLVRHRGGLVVAMLSGARGPDHRNLPGAVWSVDEDVEICGGIRIPHSVFSVDDRLIVLESGTGRVLDVTTGTAEEVARVDGFVRGVCRLGHELVVGTSAFRRISRSSDRVRVGYKPSRCALHRIDLETGAVTSVSHRPLGCEIYDLLVC
ncbi:DUF4915 domain-containing protein [Azospirillum sp. sgz302134]